MHKSYCSCSSSDWCLAEFVYFLFKTGEAMLDSAIRPYLVEVVCRYLIQERGKETLSFWDEPFLNTTFLNVSDVFRNETLYHRNDTSDLLLNGTFYNNNGVDFSQNKTMEDKCHHLDLFPKLESSVQEKSGWFLMLYRILLNIPATFLGLMCGVWSDHTGRKLPMMLPSIASLAGIVLYQASILMPRYALVLVLLGSLVQGIMGKSSVITLAVNSYVVDTTDPVDRSRRLGKLLAMNFVGLFFGALLSSFLQDICNLQVTLLVVVLFHGLSVLVVGVGVKESVKYQPIPTDDDQVDTKCSNCGSLSLQGFKASFNVLTRPRPNEGRAVVNAALFAMFLNNCCKAGEQDVTVLFVQKAPLSWPPSEYGYFLSMDYAVMGCCLLLFLPVMSRGLGMSDVSILMIGLTCKLVRSLWAGFCTKTWMVYTSVGIGALAGVITSGLRSILSRFVDDDEIGTVYGIASSGETVAKQLGSFLFIDIYIVSLGLWPGLSYICVAAVNFMLLLLAIWLYKKERVVLSLDHSISEPTESDKLNTKITKEDSY